MAPSSGAALAVNVTSRSRAAGAEQPGRRRGRGVGGQDQELPILQVVRLCHQCRAAHSRAEREHLRVVGHEGGVHGKAVEFIELFEPGASRGEATVTRVTSKLQRDHVPTTHDELRAQKWVRSEVGEEQDVVAGEVHVEADRAHIGSDQNRRSVLGRGQQSAGEHFAGVESGQPEDLGTAHQVRQVRSFAVVDQQRVGCPGTCKYFGLREDLRAAEGYSIVAAQQEAAVAPLRTARATAGVHCECFSTNDGASELD